MNRSVLVIICDFLLISILAMVDFDLEESPPPAPASDVAAVAEPELVEVLQGSLEEEARQRAELEAALAERAQSLDQTQEQLATTQAERERLEALRAELEAQRAQLSTAVTETQEQLSQVTQARETLSSDLAEQQARATFLQQQLQARQEELERAEAARQELEAAREALQAERQRLEMDLRIVQTERQALNERLTSAQAQIEVERLERQEAVAMAERLGQGVTQLAERSQAIEQEIREATPVSSNSIYQRAEQGRLTVFFQGRMDALFGTREENFARPALLVRDGGRVHALFATADSPLAPGRLGGVRQLTGSLQLGDQRLEITELSYVRGDPRVLAVQIPETMVEASGLPVFTLAAEPLRFGEVVVIGAEPGAYGELSTRLLGGGRRYLSMQRDLIQRVFGNFRPQSGDFVFSRSGELIGLMVDGERAVILDTLQPVENLALADDFNADRTQTVARQIQARTPGT